MNEKNFADIFSFATRSNPYFYINTIYKKYQNKTTDSASLQYIFLAGCQNAEIEFTQIHRFENVFFCRIRNIVLLDPPHQTY